MNPLSSAMTSKPSEDGPLHSSLCHWRVQTVRIQEPCQPRDVGDMKSRHRGRLSYSASCAEWYLRSLIEEISCGPGKASLWLLPVITSAPSLKGSWKTPPAITRCGHRHTSPWIRLHELLSDNSLLKRSRE